MTTERKPETVNVCREKLARKTKMAMSEKWKEDPV